MPTVTDAWLDAHRVDPATLAAGPLVGLAHVATEVRSLVARLRDPIRAAALGADVPRAILLHGPPGIGKTHTARHLARELGDDIPVYEVVADELSGPLIRALFAALAARHPRSILVLDEVDLVGADRADADAGVRRTLGALLGALDGLRGGGGVLVVAASNRPVWDLDPALLRAGRLGFTIEIGYPEAPERTALLRHFLAGRPLEGEPPLAALARRTDGWTPADLRAACADAAGLALADGRDAIAAGDLERAFERAGRVAPEPAPDPPLDEATVRRVAVHEAGHAVAGTLLRGVAWLRSIRVGAEGGETRFGTGEPRTEDEARAALVTGFAGLAAERTLLGGALEGAAFQDVARASSIAIHLAVSGLEDDAPPINPLAHAFRTTPAAGRLAETAARSLERARASAAILVARHARVVEEVADVLAAQAMPLLATSPRPDAVEIDLGAVRAVLARAGLDGAARIEHDPAVMPAGHAPAPRDGRGARSRADNGGTPDPARAARIGPRLRPEATTEVLS